MSKLDEGGHLSKWEDSQRSVREWPNKMAAEDPLSHLSRSAALVALDLYFHFCWWYFLRPIPWMILAGQVAAKATVRIFGDIFELPRKPVQKFFSLGCKLLVLERHLMWNAGGVGTTASMFGL